jgi:hypothetical protein
MVVMALTMFIMAVITQAFGTGLDTFRGLKGIGDLQDGLRTATTIIRNDLAQDHFEGKRRLSDPNFWQSKPREGFLAMKGSNSIDEKSDPDLLRSSRAVDHVLHFSNKLRGNRKESYFYSTVPSGSVLLNAAKPTNIVGQPNNTVYIDPAGTYASQWAEVGYYLVQTGTTTILEPGSSTPLASLPGTPLYALYRCVYVGVPSNVFVNNSEPAASIANYGGISCGTPGGNVYFYTPNDWASQTSLRRFQPANTAAAQGQASLVLANVVSFQVQGFKSSTGQFEDINAFDTTGANPGYLLQALQVSIRVFDPATRQTRQATIIQDL